MRIWWSLPEKGDEENTQTGVNTEPKYGKRKDKHLHMFCGVRGEINHIVPLFLSPHLFVGLEHFGAAINHEHQCILCVVLFRLGL